jgi:hypothetical protein
LVCRCSFQTVTISKRQRHDSCSSVRAAV